MVYYNFEFESIINTLFAQVFGDSKVSILDVLNIVMLHKIILKLNV